MVRLFRIRTEYGEIQRFFRIRTECGKIRTRETPNTDIFHAMHRYTFPDVLLLVHRCTMYHSLLFQVVSC